MTLILRCCVAALFLSQVQLICTMARVNAEHNRFAAAEKLWRRALTVCCRMLCEDCTAILLNRLMLFFIPYSLAVFVAARLAQIMRDLLAAEIAFVIRDQKLEAARESSQFSPQKHDEPSPRSRRRNHASKLAAMTNPSPSKRSFREKARAEKSKRIELGVLRRWAREIILEISKVRALEHHYPVVCTCFRCSFYRAETTVQVICAGCICCFPTYGTYSCT